jgi:hypothetical protein
MIDSNEVHYIGGLKITYAGTRASSPEKHALNSGQLNIFLLLGYWQRYSHGLTVRYLRSLLPSSTLPSPLLRLHLNSSH